MSTPNQCPHCGCQDIRPITASDVQLAGYRCHDCGRVFYAADIRMPPKRDTPPPPEPPERVH